jgi:hypothetical protein
MVIDNRLTFSTRQKQNGGRCLIKVKMCSLILATIGQLPKTDKIAAKIIRQAESLADALPYFANWNCDGALGQLRRQSVADLGRCSVDATADDASHRDSNTHNRSGQDHPIDSYSAVIIFGEFLQFHQFHLGTFH